MPANCGSVNPGAGTAYPGSANPGAGPGTGAGTGAGTGPANCGGLRGIFLPSLNPS